MTSLILLCFILPINVAGWSLVRQPNAPTSPVRKRRLTVRLQSESPTPSSSPLAKPYGRQEYWQSFYKDRDADFTWYAGWNDLRPLVEEWVAPTSSILLPGVGTDTVLRDMYLAGHQNLTAFDYAPESIEFCRTVLLKDILSADGDAVDLQTADARELPYETGSFDVVMDKGTLDAVFLAGETMSERRANLDQAVSELQRVLKPNGGIFWSLSAICVYDLASSKRWNEKAWQVLCDGSFYVTRDGYTSNNVDGTLHVWRKS